MTDLGIGDSRWTLLLQPDGHIDALARIWLRADDEYVLDTEAGYGDVVEARIKRFMLRTKAEVTRESLVAAIAVDTPEPAGELPDGQVVGWWGSGVVILTTASDAEGSSTASSDALLMARVVAGWPAMGAEIEPGERIPAEIGVARAAVSFTKGCYPGQELVERMDSRGAQAPRRLNRLDVGDDAHAGDPIVIDGDEVGALTSVAGTVALGYVKRNVEVGTPVADL